jgi:hypothetical protein
LEALFEQRRPDVVCAVFDMPTEALGRFAAAHPAGFCALPDPHERVAFWDAHLAQRAAVRDDAIPAAYLSELDQGLYGGLLGGDVRFLCDPQTGWISSMVAPLFEDIGEVGGLRIDREHPWWRRYLAWLDAFAAAAAGRFGVSHFILIDSLNFVFECVGATKTYLALMDAPQQVRALIDFAFELNVAVQEAFFARVPLVAGGTCSNMVGCGRGRVVSESVDPFHMMAAGEFDRWGREPVERMFRRFDGGVLHVHGNGRHLLEAVASLAGLRAIYLGDDKGYPPAFEVLGELRARVGHVPLVLSVPYPQFADALDRRALAGGVKYVVTGCPSVDEANRAMDRLRAYENRGR